MSEYVGFIGLGVMGHLMARNLVQAGFRLVVHNRSRPAVDELIAETGAAVVAVESPAQVARASRTIITMLPDGSQVRQVVFGPNGLLEAVKDRHLLVDMSTIDPQTAIDVHGALADLGAGALDAPVSGGDSGARTATLSIMVVGDTEHVARAYPLFTAMGKTIVHVGGPGAGQTVKACNQVVVAIAYAGLSEALILGQRSGVEPERILEVLGGGLAASRVLELRGGRMVRGDFTPGFRIDLHRKDLGIALATGREQEVPLPVTALVSQLYDAAAAGGLGNLDHSAVIRVLTA